MIHLIAPMLKIYFDSGEKGERGTKGNPGEVGQKGEIGPPGLMGIKGLLKFQAQRVKLFRNFSFYR